MENSSKNTGKSLIEQLNALEQQAAADPRLLPQANAVCQELLDSCYDAYDTEGTIRSALALSEALNRMGSLLMKQDSRENREKALGYFDEDMGICEQLMDTSPEYAVYFAHREMVYAQFRLETFQEKEVSREMFLEAAEIFRSHHMEKELGDIRMILTFNYGDDTGNGMTTGLD